MYKMVLLDLDGTLLNSNKEIGNKTKETIYKYKKSIKFVLASARSVNRMEKYIRQLGIDTADNYTIAYNGSVVIKNDGFRIIDDVISDYGVKQIKKIVNQYHNFRWQFYTFDKTYVLEEIDDVNNFIKNNSLYKVVIIGDSDDIAKIRNSLDGKIYQYCEITSSLPTRIEFVNKGSTKMNAIIHLINDLGINQSEVIAMGDAENDISMIDFSGCGVAMGNADDNVKSHADFITNSNDEDGVAFALESILNKE